jgi:hypothetical protein
MRPRARLGTEEQLPTAVSHCVQTLTHTRPGSVKSVLG